MIKVQANLNLIVGVAYVIPNTQFFFDSFDNMFQGNISIIVGGDYNAKHRVWNNFYNNTRGVRLYSYLQNISIIHSSMHFHSF